MLALAAVGLLSSNASAQEASRFELQNVNARDAVTALRVIAGTKQAEVVGEKTLIVTDNEAGLRVVANVLRLYDVKTGVSPAVSSFEVVPGESVVTRIMLHNITAPEAMTALRRELSVKNVAASMSPSLILIRDTPEKCKASKKLIESMETAAKQQS